MNDRAEYDDGFEYAKWLILSHRSGDPVYCRSCGGRVEFNGPPTTRIRCLKDCTDIHLNVVPNGDSNPQLD